MRSAARRPPWPALIVAALLSAGCGPFGSSSSATSSSPAPRATTPAAAVTTKAPPGVAAGRRALAAGASTLASAGSAEVDGTIVTQAVAGGPKVTVHVAGKERWSPSQAGTFTLTGVTVGGTAVGSATMLVTASAAYLKLPGLAAVLHKQWAKLALTGASTSLGGADLGRLAGAAQQLQPGAYLRLLAQSANVKAVGTATVDGVPTKRYSGSVDLQKALAALPDVPEVWSRLATAQGVKAAHVGAWLDAQGKPRKLTLGLGSSVVTTTITLHLSSYGVKVSVIAPPSSQTMDLTKGLLGAIP